MQLNESNIHSYCVQYIYVISRITVFADKPPRLTQVAELPLHKGCTEPDFGYNNEFIIGRKIGGMFSKNSIDMYLFHCNRHLHMFTKPLPSVVEADCDKCLSASGSIVLRDSSHTATTLVYDSDLSNKMLSVHGAFGYLMAARGDKVMYRKHYSDCRHIDVYSIETHEKLYTLTPPGRQWMNITCCVSEDGRVVVSDYDNKCLHVYDDSGECKSADYK